MIIFDDAIKIKFQPEQFLKKKINKEKNNF